MSTPISARRVLQEKGQFWTPAWVAEAMVAYVLPEGQTQIFDPAVGSGAFLLAAKKLTASRGKTTRFQGMELDPAALAGALDNGLTRSELQGVQLGDFITSPPLTQFSAIVANPPYIRHHRLSAETKAFLKDFTKQLIGMTLDGRAGLHVFFLLRALQLLKAGGRLAFILPADTCEGVFAETLWTWIAQKFRLDAVITFAPTATPFPGVDTNAVVLMIGNEPPQKEFLWARCLKETSNQLAEWVQSDFKEPGGVLEVSGGVLEVCCRSVSEGLRTGLTRRMQTKEHDGLLLRNLASVQRGIATGANDFFFMTAAQAAERGIPAECLMRAVGRTRDVEGEEITAERLQALDALGRPTYLLSLGRTDSASLPPAVQEYLKVGEHLGLPARPLIAQRKPWYKMETRTPPPFLFAYLGRRHARFIRNKAGILPLTGFLCVYPHRQEAAALEELWQLLRNPATVENLARVGKSYGSGAIKVEPRSLEKLPIPEFLVGGTELTPQRKAVQLPLRFYEKKPALSSLER